MSGNRRFAEEQNKKEKAVKEAGENGGNGKNTAQGRLQRARRRLPQAGKKEAEKKEALKKEPEKKNRTREPKRTERKKTEKLADRIQAMLSLKAAEEAAA